MRKIILLLFLLMFLSSSCSSARNTPADKERLPLTDCLVSSPQYSQQVEARCGTLSVPENPSDPQGRQVDINIAVVPAIKRVPEPDPLFVLAGGPGQSVVEVFPFMYTTLFRIHQTRDIVLVDQRGTGKSNPLRCMDPEQDMVEEQQAIAVLQSCPEKLNADLKYYTTDIAMQDLDAVRAALGYERVNLYGVSYGTRAALVYLKMYPEHVRSIVLDAVVDPAFVLYQDIAQDGQGALDLFFARCEADENCRRAYPDLKANFDSLIRRLEEAPVQTFLPHPISGKPLEVSISSGTLSNIVFSTLYTPEILATLPLAIQQAHAADNFAPLITLSHLTDLEIYDGMFYAVACIEDAPMLVPDATDAALFGAGQKTFLEVCSTWPQSQTPPVIHEAVSSDVPALLLSGEADPITPPWHAERLAGSLSNELHLIFKGMGHGNASGQCGARILADFLESASVKDLDTRCVEQVAPPPFFVDFNGPRP